MLTTEPWTRFADNLPSCCTASDRLRLPQPTEVQVEAFGGLGGGQFWDMGLDEWRVRVRATWCGQEAALAAAVRNHTRGDVPDFAHVIEVIAGHGVHLDEDLSAWVGEQDLVVAHIGNDLATASGREVISNGHDLFEAADVEAGDLANLVGQLVAAHDDEDELWCQEITDTFPGSLITDVVVLLRSVNITPVIRGHGLGAWAAAQSIALFASSNSLVTQAAPLERRDAVPGFEGHRDFTRGLPPVLMLLLMSSGDRDVLAC